MIHSNSSQKTKVWLATDNSGYYDVALVMGLESEMLIYES